MSTFEFCVVTLGGWVATFGLGCLFCNTLNRKKEEEQAKKREEDRDSIVARGELLIQIAGITRTIVGSGETPSNRAAIATFLAAKGLLGLLDGLTSPHWYTDAKLELNSCLRLLGDSPSPDLKRRIEAAIAACATFIGPEVRVFDN